MKVTIKGFINYKKDGWGEGNDYHFYKYDMSAQLAPVFQAPRPPKGEHEITLCPDWANDEPVVCHYEYVRGQKQTFDDPGCPEEWNLVSAYIRGWDCYRILSHEQIAEIEQLIQERS